jgi:hypothetical protein
MVNSLAVQENFRWFMVGILFLLSKEGIFIALNIEKLNSQATQYLVILSHYNFA